MTRTMNPSAWATRLAAVFGASVMAFALVATPAYAGKASGPNLNKKPNISQWRDGNMGAPGVNAVASVPGVDINRVDPDVEDWVLGGTEVPVRIATNGFGKGPLTVWIQSYGNSSGVGRTPWRKFVVTPNKDGVVDVTVKPAKRNHCSAVLIRVNDKAGKWVEKDINLTVYDEAPGDNETPAEFM